MNEDKQLAYALEHIDRRVDDLKETRLTQEEIRDAVTHGVVEGIKALAADDEFSEKFWRSGFQKFASHAGDNASQWIGKRILTALVVACVTAGIVWMVKAGSLK